MDNIVKFPKAKRREPPAVERWVDDDNDPAAVNECREAAKPRFALLKSSLSWTWLIVRIPLFLVLYWLRLPVMFICSLISVPLLLLWLFSLYAFPDKTDMIWLFGIASFAAFIIMWIYDLVLMALSPQDMMKTL